MSDEKRARDVVAAAVARITRRADYGPDRRARLERNFPWPSTGSLRDAAESLADERDRRVVYDLGNALDVGIVKAPEDVVLSDEDTVAIVVQALRGQRVRWTPAIASDEKDGGPS